MESNKPDTMTEKIELDVSSSKSSERKRIKEVYQKLEITLVIFLIVVVWGLLSLPVIFFHLPEEVRKDLYKLWNCVLILMFS